MRRSIGIAVVCTMGGILIGSILPLNRIPASPALHGRALESLHLCKAASAKAIRTLEKLWLTNTGDAMDRWLQYADGYGRHLKKYMHRPEGKTLRMLEIGIQNGGGWAAWREFFGQDLLYVGADVDPRCQVLKDVANNRYVEIGDQSDPRFLKMLCDNYGPFDIIIDDGGHTCHQIMTSLLHLFNCMTNEATYLMEDTHSIVFFGGPTGDLCYGDKPLQYHMADVYTSMMAYQAWPVAKRANYSSDVFKDNVESVHMYDSMVVIERAKLKPLTRVITGGQCRVTEQWPESHMGVTEHGVGKSRPTEYIKNHPELTDHSKSLHSWW